MVQLLNSGDSETLRPHVLMVPLDFVGHFFPWLQLLYHMVRYDGLTVTVMSSKERIEELTGLRSRGDFGGLDLRLKVVFGNIPMTKTDSNFPIRSAEVVEHWRKDLKPVTTKLTQDKNLPGGPTALVVDFLLFWLDDLANELGIPWYSIYTAGPAYGLAVFHTPMLVAEGMHPYDSPEKDQDLTIVGLEFCRIRDLMADIVEFDEYHLLHSEKMRKARALLFNTAEGIDAPAGSLNALRACLHNRSSGKEVPPAVMAIGPILNCPGFMLSPNSTTDTVQKAPCLEFLDSQAPLSVLYVAFGSITTISTKCMADLALGLEASGLPFLLVLKCHESVLSPGFEERVRGRGFLETGWAPQTRILAHPSTGGFLTHCGWNSTLESMCLGVPVITWPMSVDQGLNARFLEIVAKVAIPLKGMNEEITREEVERAVKLLMVDKEGKEIRKNAIGMKHLFKETMVEGASSQQTLKWFMNDLLKISK